MKCCFRPKAGLRMGMMPREALARAGQARGALHQYSGVGGVPAALRLADGLRAWRVFSYLRTWAA